MSKLHDDLQGMLLRVTVDDDYKMIYDIDIDIDTYNKMSQYEKFILIFQNIEKTIGKRILNINSLLITEFYLIKKNDTHIKMYKQTNYYNEHKLKELWKQIQEENLDK